MLNLLRKLWHSATGPSVPIRRPDGLSRRDFLRSMGVTTMAVGLGGMGSSLWKPLGKGKVYGARGEVIEVGVTPKPKVTEFYAYETPGAAIGNTKALLRADFIVTTKKTREQLLNEALFNQLQSSDPELNQRAVDAVNAFTRTKMREDGFYRRVMPLAGIRNDQLDRELAKWGRDELDDQTRREIMQLGWRA